MCYSSQFTYFKSAKKKRVKVQLIIQNVKIPISRHLGCHQIYTIDSLITCAIPRFSTDIYTEKCRVEHHGRASRFTSLRYVHAAYMRLRLRADYLYNQVSVERNFIRIKNMKKSTQTVQRGQSASAKLLTIMGDDDRLRLYSDRMVCFCLSSRRAHSST